MELFTQFVEKISDLNAPGRFCIAFSGGLDSSVLLDLFSKSKQNVFAIYIHHGLNPKADAWGEHCQTICAQHNIPFETLRVNAKANKGESPQHAARHARYVALAEKLNANDYLVTAHHRDDQSETLLLQLFRGAGVKGLAAMPELAKFSAGHLWRPLLDVSRQDLEIYAQQNNLTWIEDDSNLNTRYARNYLRQEVMPLLKSYWPGINQALQRAASHCAAADELLTEIAKQDLPEVSDALPLEKLQSLSTARQVNLIRYWLLQLKFAIPNDKHIQQLLNTMIQAKQDATPLLHWPGVEIRRYADTLYAMHPLSAHDSQQVIPWDGQSTLSLANQLGDVSLLKTAGQGIAAKHLTTAKQLSIRFRQGGERFHPAGRSGSHPLKKLMQEWKIPPWLRERVPLLYLDDELIAVANYAVKQQVVAGESTAGFCFQYGRRIS